MQNLNTNGEKMRYQINFSSWKSGPTTLNYMLVEGVVAAEVGRGLLMLTLASGVTRNYPLENIESFAQLLETEQEK